jgi:glycine hydroxymethyltransferase
MKDYLERRKIKEIDPNLYELLRIEEERQYRRLILIPSESMTPKAIRRALGSGFHNIYAEGYAFDLTGGLSEDELFDYDRLLTEYRRYSDDRYYKGVEYADILEGVACQRAATAFAANGKTALDIYVNVQPLSGGPANNAVYHGLVDLGDTVMGMNLLHGGHLSHGSRVNRSGEFYNIVSYSVNPETEKLDYDEIEALAKQHRPKMIIAGVSSYSWQLDWARFREIADMVGAYLLADISHVAGLIVAGEYPSPIGHAHIISSTTHKTLLGPRGAILMSTDLGTIQAIDRAVFPGEQGGPHVNVFGAMALAFKLAKTPEFTALMKQIVKNCKVLNDRLEERGFRIPFGGTNTHLTNIDTKSVRGKDDAWLSGDLAARILDVAGLVTNRNTIPGDKSALNPSGVRLGTPWISQRGLKEEETRQIADIIADVLFSCEPYYQGRGLRAKVDFKTLEEAKLKVRDLAQSAGIDYKPSEHGYPHFYYLDDEVEEGKATSSYIITGDKSREFLDYLVSCDVETMECGTNSPALLYTPEEEIPAMVTCDDLQSFHLTVPADKSGLVLTWLRAVSDGYVRVDEDVLRKIPGPVIVRESDRNYDSLVDGDPYGLNKPFYLGMREEQGEALPDFVWKEQTEDGQEEAPKRTRLYDLHVELGARMVPFAGWEMPVRYDSVMEEHNAVREAAGLFDVTHMGVLQVEGPDAMAFLDSVVGNDVSALDLGESAYAHFLDPDANVLDDTLIYRRSEMEYMVVVNASNEPKVWKWLNEVKAGTVKVDNQRPWAKAYGIRAILRNLKNPLEGSDQRVDLALQGPRSKEILLSLDFNADDERKINHLRWSELCEVSSSDYDLVVARTGYTGEKTAYELFVHPDKVEALFRELLEVGKPFGLKPCGLGARDSLRTEAGLPLYGLELAGEMNIGVGGAGFGSFVKVNKPWFIGRAAYLAREQERDNVIARFRFSEKRVRKAHYGDPVMDEQGRVIGKVTSCATDSEGYFLGQAFVNRRYAKKGTLVYIYQDVEKRKGVGLTDLSYGERVALPDTATILRRFPKF